MKTHRPSARDDNSVAVPLVLLAMDAEGYSNLCQLTTLRHLGALRLGQETFAEDASRAVTLEELATHSAGVMALWPASALLRMDLARRGAACCALTKAPASESGRYTTAHNRSSAADHESRVTNHESPTTDFLTQLKSIFGDRLYLAVQHLSPGDGRILREAEQLGRGK